MGLDAIELIVGWEKAFGVEINDKEAESLLTPKMAMDLLSDKLSASASSTGVCPNLRSLSAVRLAFQTVLALERQQVRLDSKLDLILPKQNRRQVWQEIQYAIAVPDFPRLDWGRGIILQPLYVRDIVNWLTAYYPCLLLNYNELWAYFQIRSVVRAVIRDVAGVDDFSDETEWWMLTG